MAHQHLGLAEIQNHIGLGELFDTLAVFENYPIDRGSLAADVGGLRLPDISGHDGTHYSLSLMAVPGERIQLRLDYRPDLFDRASVEAMAGRLVRLLEAAAADPDRTIGSLDILSPAERRTILHGWNDTARAVPSATLPELFAAQVARTPDAVAVVFEDQSLTYGELDARSSQLAHHLRDLGVGPETVVALCVERSPAMLIGLLGILKAGGTYLPLDPGYPHERLAFMLEDAGAPVLLTHSALLDRLPAHGAHTVRLDADWPAIAQQPTSAPASFLQPHHPAYVVYTSGSTGTPKGVVVDHASFANKLLTLREHFKVGPDFRTALYLSCAFDASIKQAMLPLIGGGATVVTSDAVQESPSQFWQHVGRTGVSFINFVPSYLDSIVRHAPETAFLQHLILGGEAFTTELRTAILQHLATGRVANHYGPTETTIDAISFAVEGEQPG